MSASADLQNAVRDVLGMDGRLRVSTIERISRREKDLANEIDASAANNGLCIWVMPPLPTSFSMNGPDVFFDKAEIRVRIVEKVNENGTGADAYDLMDDVAQALHWEPKKSLDALVEARMESEGEDLATAAAAVEADPANAPLVALGTVLTAHPMYLAARPTEMIEDQNTRLLDVIFEAPYGLLPA